MGSAYGRRFPHSGRYEPSTGLRKAESIALTDLPIGAWTCSVVIDAMESATGRTELGPGADAAIGIGLVGAVGAVVTGLTDYQHADTSEARRTGLAHAALNAITTGCFLTSYVLRKNGSRGTGKVWSVAGLSIGMLAARLGGDMVFKYGVNVDRTNGQEANYLRRTG